MKQTFETVKVRGLCSFFGWAVRMVQAAQEKGKAARHDARVVLALLAALDTGLSYGYMAACRANMHACA